MYAYFALMGCVSVAVMLGYRYRLSIILLTLLWAGAYYIQKTSYNNHYYLLLVICFYMCFLPANRYAALDVRLGRIKEELAMPVYYSWIFILQVSILYVYGTIAKFYPDWLNGTFTQIMYQGTNIPQAFKDFVTQKEFYIAIAYLGILFDGLIVPMLLWKKTRTLAIMASLIFHLFNSVTLQIGIFPYFALSFAVFFYPSDQMRRLFFKKKPAFVISEDYTDQVLQRSLSKGAVIILSIFMLFQLLLPLRQHFIKGDILWTDEAHRLSWRMMLRSRGGYTNFIVKNKQTGERSFYPLETVLTPKQKVRLNTPDMIWQMTQYIKKEYEAKGIEVAIYVDSWVSINGREYSRFVNPEVDFSVVKWDYFKHSDWILEKPF